MTIYSAMWSIYQIKVFHFLNRYVTDHERRAHGHYRSREGGAISADKSGDSMEKKLECRLCYNLFDSKE